MLQTSNPLLTSTQDVLGSFETASKFSQNSDIKPDVDMQQITQFEGGVLKVNGVTDVKFSTHGKSPTAVSTNFSIM
jgi:hypothetical protein